MKIDSKKFEFYLLYFCLFLSLVRSSGIGFAYPNIESLLGYANYTHQKIIQAFILILLVIYFYLFPNRVFFNKSKSLPVLLLFVSIFFSICFSNHFVLSTIYFLSFIVVSLPVILFANVFNVTRLVNFVSYFLFLLLILSFVYIFVFPYYGIMGGNHAGSFRGMFLHKNVFGFFCVMTSIFCLYSFFSVQIKGRKRFFLIYLLCLLGVVKSLSTTSLVLFLLSFIVFNFFCFVYFFSDIRLRVLFYYSFVFIMFVLLFFLSVYFEELTYALGKDPTLTGRTELWEVLFYIGLDNSFWGHGFGLFYRPEIMHQYSSDFGWEAKSTHNSFLDLFLGLGFLV